MSLNVIVNWMAVLCGMTVIPHNTAIQLTLVGLADKINDVRIRIGRSCRVALDLNAAPV